MWMFSATSKPIKEISLSLKHQNVNFVLYFLILWMGAEWAALKHCKESCSQDISDTARIEISSWDFQFTFAKRRHWDKHLILKLIQKIAYGERIIFYWAKAQDESLEIWILILVTVILYKKKIYWH